MALRLTKERNKIEKSENEHFFIETTKTDLEWVMKIIIENEQSCYNQGVFTVVLNFPAVYPFKPPTVQFTPPVYHPGIHQETGEVCSDLLRTGWGPTRNVEWIMNVLYTMFVTECTDNIVDTTISNEKENNYELFKMKVQKQIEEFGKL